MHRTLILCPWLALLGLGSLASAQCELAKLTGSDTVAMDDFGTSIDIDGSFAIVGAPNDDEGGVDRGSAYVFENVAGTWTQVAKLTPSTPANSDLFGFTVAISGDTAVVGALAHDLPGSLVDAGAVFVFENQGGSWVETQKLTADDAGLGDLFGIGLDVDGDRIAVGACQLTAFIVFGLGPGKTYVFDRPAGGGPFTQTQKLAASDAGHGDAFGIACALEGDRLLIGAEEDDDGGASSGSAYVFELQGGTWTQDDKLVAADDMIGDFFGAELSLSGDLALIAAIDEDEGGTDAGAAYVFERQGPGDWAQVQKLIASDASAQDQFGNSLEIVGEKIVVGAYQNLGTTSGAIYVFDRIAGVWAETARLVASDSMLGDELGYAVSLAGDTIVAGARSESGQGSVYAFSSATAATGIYGCGVNPPGSMMVLSGRPRLGMPVTVGLSNPAGSQAIGSIPFLAFALSPAPGFPCGVALPSFGMSGPAGELLISLAPPNPVGPILIGPPWTGSPSPIQVVVPPDCGLVGQSVFAQGLMLDPTAPPGGVKFGLTDAVELAVGP